MKFTFKSESGGPLGIGNTMHLSSVLDHLKYRVNETKHDLVLIDATYVSEATVKWHHDDGAKVVLFNNLNEEANSLADVAVNGEHKGFENIVRRNGTRLHFLGPRYLFLRDEFLTPGMMQVWRRRSHIKVVGIMLGGTDPLGLTPRLYQELAGLDVRPISGKNIAVQMLTCDLMCTGCGIGFWESLAVGTPAIPFAANPEHEAYYSPTFKLGKPGHILEMIAREDYTIPSEKWSPGMGANEVVEEILRD